MCSNNPNPLKSNNSTTLKKKLTKSTHVPTACLNCKKAHLACDLSRPCKRCVSLDKSSTCIDIKHKKRGRPKLSDKRWLSGISESNVLASPSHLTEINLAPIRQQPSPPSPLSTLPNSSSNSSYSRSSVSSASPSPPPSFAHLLPLTTPLLPTSTFEITQKQNNRKNDYYPTKMMTLFLTMDLCCARVSDESVDILGRRPDTIGHCSFYELIQSASINTLSRIHRLLLDNCHSAIQQKHPISFSTTAKSDLFQKTSPLQLFSIANGSQTFKEKLTFNKNEENVALDCKFYLGGAFGADLSEPSTLENVYIVCIATEPPVTQSPSTLSDFITSATIEANMTQDILSFVSSSAVDSLLAHNQVESHLYPISDTPDFLTTYNSPNPLHEKDAMDLVNRLYCSVVTPTPNSDTSLGSKSSTTHGFLQSSPMSDTYSDDSIVDNSNTILNENSLIMLSKTPPRIKLGSGSDNLW
ncbi:hypothetical protein K501DRAFT_334188 [Backusella circina FSU 941]|nr:hypothetical protein K501DRAFT_334188 [Backusella circina FSU 941]